MAARGNARRPRVTWWVGPIAYAAVMICVAGIFNVTSGLTAMFSDSLFVTGPSGSLVLNELGWGWVHLIIGVMLFATGVGVLMGALWAQLSAIILVAINMCSQLLLLPAFPLWSIVIIAFDAVVLWALMNHSQEIPAS